MPWKRAKALPPPDNTLFDACFRIQREACEAAEHHIPLIVENVRGAQKWVGRARWNFGSFYLWGDVPALMPITLKTAKVPSISWSGSDKPDYVARAFNGTAASRLQADGLKTHSHPHIRNGHRSTGKLTDPSQWRQEDSGIKAIGGWSADGIMRRGSSKSKSRKFASAMIAKIPLPLSRHIAATFRT